MPEFFCQVKDVGVDNAGVVHITFEGKEIEPGQVATIAPEAVKREMLTVALAALSNRHRVWVRLPSTTTGAEIAAISMTR